MIIPIFTELMGSSDESDVVIEKQRVWLSLVNENSASTTALVGYAEHATYGIDNLYDATAEQDEFSIYSVIDDSPLSIQGRPLPFTATDQVPMGISISENGIYNIAIDDLDGSVFVEQNQGIYLEDTYSNIHP